MGLSDTTSWDGRLRFSHPNLSMFFRKIWSLLPDTFDNYFFFQPFLQVFIFYPISNSIPCVFFCFSSQTYTRFKPKSTLTKALSFPTSSSFISPENFTGLHHSMSIFPFQLKPSSWRTRWFLHMEGGRNLLILRSKYIPRIEIPLVKWYRDPKQLYSK